MSWTMQESMLFAICRTLNARIRDMTGLVFCEGERAGLEGKSSSSQCPLG